MSPKYLNSLHTFPLPYLMLVLQALHGYDVEPFFWMEPLTEIAFCDDEALSPGLSFFSLLIVVVKATLFSFTLFWKLEMYGAENQVCQTILHLVCFILGGDWSKKF